MQLACEIEAPHVKRELAQLLGKLEAASHLHNSGFPTRPSQGLPTMGAATES